VTRIVLEINVIEEGVRIQPIPYRWVGKVANAQGHQIARDLMEYFRALLDENPAATAVADALSHEPGPVFGKDTEVRIETASGERFVVKGLRKVGF